MRNSLVRHSKAAMEVQILPNHQDERGLFATRNYARSEVIRTFQGVELDHPAKESIYVGGGVHIVDAWGQFINHSFHPTCAVRGRSLIALTNISEGEELTFNYNESELPMACPFRTQDCQLVKGNMDADLRHLLNVNV